MSIENTITIITPIATIVLAFLGLSTWRKKLWGENKFSLATSTIKELYVLKKEIENYRNGFYSAGEIYNAVQEYKRKFPDEKIDDQRHPEYAENRRWNLVVDQYEKYNNDLVKLKVLLNNYNIDQVNERNMDYYLHELNIKRMQKQYNDNRKNIQYLDEERRENILNRE